MQTSKVALRITFKSLPRNLLSFSSRSNHHSWPTLTSAAGSNHHSWPIAASFGYSTRSAAALATDSSRNPTFSPSSNATATFLSTASHGQTSEYLTATFLLSGMQTSKVALRITFKSVPGNLLSFSAGSNHHSWPTLTSAGSNHHSWPIAASFGYSTRSAAALATDSSRNPTFSPTSSGTAIFFSTASHRQTTGTDSSTIVSNNGRFDRDDDNLYFISCSANPSNTKSNVDGAASTSDDPFSGDTLTTIRLAVESGAAISKSTAMSAAVTTEFTRLNGNMPYAFPISKSSSADNAENRRPTFMDVEFIKK
nr:hypothetical protein Iba_chr08bCG5790 [Ipomoea batatas]